jgi:hypothetical protein
MVSLELGGEHWNTFQQDGIVGSCSKCLWQRTVNGYLGYHRSGLYPERECSCTESTLLWPWPLVACTHRDSIGSLLSYSNCAFPSESKVIRICRFHRRWRPMNGHPLRWVRLWIWIFSVDGLRADVTQHGLRMQILTRNVWKLENSFRSRPTRRISLEPRYFSSVEIRATQLPTQPPRIHHHRGHCGCLFSLVYTWLTPDCRMV